MAAHPERMGAGDPDVEDVLEIGRERRRSRLLEAANRIPPRLRYAATVVAVTAAFVIGYLANNHSGAPQPSATPSAAAAVGKPDDYQSIVLLVRQPSRLVDYVRATSSPHACAVVRVGHPPLPGIERALRAGLPGYRVRDVGRVLDQFTGLCSLEVRARDPQGSALVLQVASPLHRAAHKFVAVTIGSRSDGRTVVTRASAVAPSGWSVTVGTVGPPSDQPPAQNLLRVAQDPAMRW